MVYPADLTFNQKGNNPIIHVDMEQVPASEDGLVEATKNLTPYVSEVLNLEVGDEETNPNSAGYGRKYDISMRRMAGQLRLAINATNGGNLDVSKIKYKKVTMSVTDNPESNPFTSDMEIMIGKKRNATKTATKTTTELGGDNTGKEYWAYTPWIEPTADGKKNTISTEDVDQVTKKAYFTLLPSDDKDDKVFSSTEKPRRKDGITLPIGT